MTKKLKLGWTEYDKLGKVIKGLEINRAKIKGGHLIRWITDSLTNDIYTYLTTGGGDTWMYYEYVLKESVMNSFCKNPLEWTLVEVC